MKVMSKELQTPTLESKRLLRKDPSISIKRRVNLYLWMICKMYTSKPKLRKESNITSLLTPRVSKETSLITLKPEDLLGPLSETSIFVCCKAQ